MNKNSMSNKKLNQQSQTLFNSVEDIPEGILEIEHKGKFNKALKQYLTVPLYPLDEMSYLHRYIY